MVRRRSTVRFRNGAPDQDDNSNVSNSGGGHSGGQVNVLRPQAQMLAGQLQFGFSSSSRRRVVLAAAMPGAWQAFQGIGRAVCRPQRSDRLSLS